jgi:hypothetical protein
MKKLIVGVFLHFAIANGYHTIELSADITIDQALPLNAHFI